MTHALRGLSRHEILTIVTEIVETPKAETSLCLAANFLGRRRTSELGVMLSSIPEHITSLSLSTNLLHLKPGEELAEAITKLRDTVTALDLSGNCLFRQYSSEELAYMESSNTKGTPQLLPWSKTVDELATIFANIPPKVSSLGLGYNNLDERELDEIIAVFAALPASVTSLDLRGNNLCSFFTHETELIEKQVLAELEEAEGEYPSAAKMTRDQIDRLIKLQIQETIKYRINLLIELIGKLPEHITTIDLRENFFGIDLPEVSERIAAATRLGVTINFGEFSKAGRKLPVASLGLPIYTH